MTRGLLHIAIGLLLTSCYKDDVDIDTLVTNPLDADYTGAAFIFVTGHDTYSPVSGVYNQEVYVTVDASVFPSATAYKLRVREVNSGEVEALPQDLSTPHEFTFTNFNVGLGVEYCYEISIEIELSHSREEGFCATAEL